VQLPLVNFVLSVAWLVIQKVCQGYHHSRWEGPPEAPGTSEVVHLEEDLTGRTLEGVPVQRQDLGELSPLIFNFLSIDLCLLLELIVTQAVYLFWLPKAYEVTLIHHIDIGPPVRLRSLQILCNEENSKGQLVRIWVLKKQMRVFLYDLFQHRSIPNSGC
jgi:hypothetical protein